MFEITSDDIERLNDVDLRELIGRLCEAELTSLGLSPAAVTWGGNQTASDGGLDVRVALPPEARIEGFVPRRATGFQVKKPDMPRAEILREMCPKGTVRPVIQDLAVQQGAYVIVSSTGSVTDSALGNRKNAMREALGDIANADQLQTDFYDRTRLATWVRQHPGIVVWARSKIGRALQGWRPYGSWCGSAEGLDAEYLLDESLRMRLGIQREATAQSVIQAIDQIRDELSTAGKVVRLVGLSGVGKTRLAQALFDPRIGARPLPQSLAVYADMSDDPDPQPTGLATDLIANRSRAVLIVDNCAQDLHRRLSELCSNPSSTISVLTVEYDIRDDQPEGTHVVTLETSSLDLIGRLVRRRYKHISQVDALTIAEASGGNARIAIALSETVGRTDTISGLSNDELFGRLFRQRHSYDRGLLLAAQACSLVYSFQGEALVGDDAELPRLASLVGQVPVDIYRYVSELLRRSLVQQRGVWRAILPHAVANRLAALALEDIPYDLINRQLVQGGTDRLARSFSRRLSFLHGNNKAASIVETWLAEGGLLGNVSGLNETHGAMLENVASVMPEHALAALERVGISHPDIASSIWWRYRVLLRSIAYEAIHFERCAKMLSSAATHRINGRETKEATDIFSSLFTIYLSGTHATIKQRIALVESLLRSAGSSERALGLAALGRVLATSNFTSNYRFEFGALSRDYGYIPRSDDDVTGWYFEAFEMIERLAVTERMMRLELGALLARNFYGLWSVALVRGELEGLFRKFAADGFWKEGWSACRRGLRFMQKNSDEDAPRLSRLEADLRPSNLIEQVRAIVLSNGAIDLILELGDSDEGEVSEFQNFERTCHELGSAVANDDTVFSVLLTDVIHGGSGAWAFGRGLAGTTPDRRKLWEKIVAEFESIEPAHRSLQVLRGILAETWELERDLAQSLLDSALDSLALRVDFPWLQSAVGLDQRGVARLSNALREGLTSVLGYRNLALGQVMKDAPSGALKDLLLLISEQPDGFDVAREILVTCIAQSRLAQQALAPEILEAGQLLLRRITFAKSGAHDTYELAEIVKACVAAPQTASVAAEIVGHLKEAVGAYEAHAFQYAELLAALLEAHPEVVLDVLCSGSEVDRQVGVRAFENHSQNFRNPSNVISCETLISWCNADRDLRYPFAAAIVTFSSNQKDGKPEIWSEQARALISNAPEPKSVLTAFVERFPPNSWMGSRASIMEGRAALLDDLPMDTLPDLLSFLRETKLKFLELVAQERKWETQRDRAMDERFE